MVSSVKKFLTVALLKFFYGKKQQRRRTRFPTSISIKILLLECNFSHGMQALSVAVDNLCRNSSTVVLFVLLENDHTQIRHKLHRERFCHLSPPVKRQVKEVEMGRQEIERAK